jgi:hypothetical protein
LNALSAVAHVIAAEVGRALGKSPGGEGLAERGDTGVVEPAVRSRRSNALAAGSRRTMGRPQWRMDSNE